MHSIHYADATKRISAKFKLIRKSQKTWARKLSPLKEDISHLNSLISLLDAIENFRDLSLMEHAFRKATKNHLAALLKQQLV
jgi:hypothetical protein